MATLYCYIRVDWRQGVVLEGVGLAVEVNKVCILVALGIFREFPVFYIDGLVAPPRLGSAWREDHLEGDVAGETFQYRYECPHR